jgi:osmotically-inducible protein OsmY
MLLLAATNDAAAQTRTGSSGGASGGSFSGSSGSSFSGGSFGGSSFSGGSFGGNSFSGSSFSGNSFSGSSFSGSSFGGNFSGSSGGSSFSGGGYSGGRGGSSSLYQGVSNTNPFGQYYANPMAAGISGTSTTSQRFGQPLYNMSTSSGGSSYLGGSGSYLGGSGGSFLGNTPGGGSTSNAGATGTHLSPFGIAMGSSQPSTTPARTAPRLVSSRVQAEVSQVLARSSVLSAKNNIQVFIDGEAVVLRGTVADESERHLAESLIRFTPDVYVVRNELKVSGSGP